MFESFIGHVGPTVC